MSNGFGKLTTYLPPKTLTFTPRRQGPVYRRRYPVGGSLPYSEGSYFRIKGLFNHPTFSSDNEYQSYSAEFDSYHEMSDRLVLAWQVAGCYRSGTVPLWDTCRVGLRGFAATDYLGKASALAQFEARWRWSERWGVVGFAGGGYIDSSFSEVDDSDIIPSYGVGLRFMVLKSKRINMRVDYGRSDNSDAIHLSVGEAF